MRRSSAYAELIAKKKAKATSNNPTFPVQIRNFKLVTHYSLPLQLYQVICKKVAFKAQFHNAPLQLSSYIVVVSVIRHCIPLHIIIYGNS